MPKDGENMSFQDNGTAQGKLVADTWADLQAALDAPANAQTITAKRAAHCAALNGLAYTWDQKYGSDVQTYSGGTEKPKTLAY